MTTLRNRVFLDTETDGVRRGRRVWDVGLVKYDADGKRKEWSLMVDDVDLSEAESSSLTIGHFRRRHPAAGGTPEANTLLLPEREVAKIVFTETFEAVIAGIVVNFDELALDNMLRRNGFCWTGWHHLVCVENQALGALRGHARHVPEIAAGYAELLTGAVAGRWKTDDIAAAYGIPALREEMRHTAYGDAVLAEMIFRASVVDDDFLPLPGATWQPPEELQRALDASSLVTA